MLSSWQRRQGHTPGLVDTGTEGPARAGGGGLAAGPRALAVPTPRLHDRSYVPPATNPGGPKSVSDLILELWDDEVCGRLRAHLPPPPRAVLRPSPWALGSGRSALVLQQELEQTSRATGLTAAPEQRPLGCLAWQPPECWRELCPLKLLLTRHPRGPQSQVQLEHISKTPAGPWRKPG